MKMPTHEINEKTSDSNLIRLLCKREEAALNEIMRRYKDKIFAFICRYVRDEDAAYDIVQEVFIRVYFKAESYNSSYKFSTWLYQIAINLCRDWGRKQKIRQFFSLDAPINDGEGGSYHDIIAAPDDNSEDIAGFRKNLEILDKEIEKLPHKLKTALILFVIEENSQEQCAEILGVTIKTIETRVYRARKFLAKKIDKIF